MPLDLDKLGRRIAARRAWKRMSQQELAKEADLTQATIARIERGRKPGVHVQTLVAIADALGVSVDYLLGRGKAEDEDDEPHLARAGA